MQRESLIGVADSVGPVTGEVAGSNPRADQVKKICQCALEDNIRFTYSVLPDDRQRCVSCSTTREGQSQYTTYTGVTILVLTVALKERVYGRTFHTGKIPSPIHPSVLSGVSDCVCRWHSASKGTIQKELKHQMTCNQPISRYIPWRREECRRV